MKLNIDPKVREIRSMKVAEIVSLVNEINKPPGGIMTLNEIIIHAHISNKTKLLEIGSTTGYSSIQIKRLTGANVYGIDVNKTSVEYAKRNSEKEGVKVDFRVTDATNLPFKDESFDVIYASNVTSFINDKTSAINNYIRTLKTYGFLAVVPIYYIKHPPKSLLNTVSKEIGAEIKDFNRDYWTDLFNIGNSITSRRLLEFVNNAVSLSIPIPAPDTGGIPYSIASR